VKGAGIIALNMIASAVVLIGMVFWAALLD
jgi:hypothetical protein